MAGFLAVVRGFALLVARVVLGGVLLAHGFDRWQLRGIGSQVDYLEQFGVPYPLYATWGAILLEMVGGVFLAAGALTPLVAAAVVTEQVSIIAWTNWYRGPYLLNPDASYNGGWEYNAALAALALILVTFGAGGASVDRLFRRGKQRKPDEETSASGATSSTGSSGRSASSGR